MQIVTLQGPPSMAHSLSIALRSDPLLSTKVTFSEDSRIDQCKAACNIILETGRRGVEAFPIHLNTLVWKSRSAESTALSSWIAHHLEIKPLSISVIIPVYNREKHLELCLQALQQQSIPAAEYEIIVIDDGSKDHSAEVAQKYGAKVISTPNKGPAAARNRGIEAAQGDILIFLDADILVNAHYLFDVRKRHSRTNALLLLGARRHLPEGIVDPSAAPIALDSREKLLRRYSFCLSHLNCPWSVAYTCNFSLSKNFLGSVRFDENYVGWGLEDIDFAYKLYKQGAEIVFSRGICGYHLYHDRTLTPARYQSWLINLHRFLEKHQDNNAQRFSLFKGVFDPAIKENYFDVFDRFENRPAPKNPLEVWDLTEISEEPVQWIQKNIHKAAGDILLLGCSSNAFLEAYLPFLGNGKIKAFIPKEDWHVVEAEFRARYAQECYV